MTHVSRETLTAEAFRAATGVDEVALDRLRRYADLLVKWQARINLVGPGTLPDLWRRHILDSAQLLPLLGDVDGPVVDLGAGAGLPGLVLAACGISDVHLIESNHKKAAFLREAARVMAVDVTVHAARIDAVRLDRPAAVVTARALAPLDVLLGHAERLADAATRCVFLKGQDVDTELTNAAKSWKLRHRLVDSLSDPTGKIVVVEEFARV